MSSMSPRPIYGLNPAGMKMLCHPLTNAAWIGLYVEIQCAVYSSRAIATSDVVRDFHLAAIFMDMGEKLVSIFCTEKGFR
jgi:hypothetical protein